MNFNGTIIITDPCYIVKNDKDWGGVDGFDYNNNTVSPLTGISNYLWEDTGVGDGRWKVSKMKDILGLMELEKFVEDIEEAYYSFNSDPSIENQIKLDDLICKRETIGRYCVDSGTFGVFYLDEVLKYRPDFLVEHGDWCYTIIEDFTGEVDVYTDSREQKHFLGIGNKTFYSNTVSWL